MNTAASRKNNKDRNDVLHITALANTLAISPKRKIRLIRDIIQQDVPKSKRRITLMREVVPAQKIVEKKKQMPPRKKAATMLTPIEEKVIMVHVSLLEKKMAVAPVDDVETVRLVLFNHSGKSYYRDTAKNKLFLCVGPKTIGSYVGRRDSLENTIRTDITDSDTE